MKSIRSMSAASQLREPTEARFLTVAIIGARRERQGTGHYLATAFAKLEHQVTAITTTREESLREALSELNHAGIKLNNNQGYTCAQTMLRETKPDVLVIASPAPSHLEYISLGLAHGCHVLCEKPLFVPATALADNACVCDDLCRQFINKQRHLAVNTQWPQTLPTFARLYPKMDLRAKQIATFGMRLCPESTCIDMLMDSAPHFLSMLYALCGEGDITELTTTLGTQKSRIQLTLRHKAGTTRAWLDMERYLGQPKPAEYVINGAMVKRHIQMPDYLLSLENDAGERIAMRDPLLMTVEKFIRHIESKAPPDDGICVCMRQLDVLVARSKDKVRNADK